MSESLHKKNYVCNHSFEDVLFVSSSMPTDLYDDNLKLQIHLYWIFLEDTKSWFEYYCEENESVSGTDGSIKPTAAQHMGDDSQLPSVFYHLYQSRRTSNTHRIDLSYQLPLLEEETCYCVWERGKETPWKWASAKEWRRRWLPASPRERAKASWDVLLQDSQNLVLRRGVLRAVGKHLWPVIQPLCPVI